MPNFRMTLSYDGTRYNGWQRQGNTPDTPKWCPECCPDAASRCRAFRQRRAACGHFGRCAPFG